MSARGEINVKLISPATTPCSTQDDERCLTTTYYPGDDYKKKWNSPVLSLLPGFMFLVSICQILVFLLADEEASRVLRFEPSVRWQVHRFVTYMLIHFGTTHLVLNVVIQCVLAFSLEVEQGGARSLTVYFGGGLFGAVGACLVQPQPMVGASAGIYALLTSNLAHIFLNFDSVKYKIYRLFCVFMLATSDIAFYIFHTSTSGYPAISLGAHASGGLAGLLLGLIVYKNSEGRRSTARRVAFWGSLVLTILIFVAATSLIIVLPQEHFDS